MNFSTKVIHWYDENKRALPWRKTADPYNIWISEIILQQTRVEQGTEYYYRFLDRFPDIKTLALANEDDVLKIWQGLGYYSRARNLHLAARSIIAHHNGIFPSDYTEILALKGIGEYTASAIASIAFNEPYATVDGNVIRVISRIFGIQGSINKAWVKNKIKFKANELIDKKNPGTFNQAMMEFGALYCRPANPKCQNCLFKKECFAFKNGLVDKIPFVPKKNKLRKRYLYYLVCKIQEQGNFFTLISKRENNDIWKNLYDFPHYDYKSKQSIKKIIVQLTSDCKSQSCEKIKFSKEYQHTLSHQKIIARFITFETGNRQPFNKNHSVSPKNMLLIEAEKFYNYPIPRLIEKFVDENQIFN
ncbi:MAG: A/G-specific adenine glycosylase [Bacteroidales bacterium]